MKISILNTNQYQPKQNQANFKAVYPVVHWVAESNGSYVPLAIMDVVEAFQEKIISCLNKRLLTPQEIKTITKKKKNLKDNVPASHKEKNEIEKLKETIDIPAQYLRAYLSSCDVSYRLNP